MFFKWNHWVWQVWITPLFSGGRAAEITSGETETLTSFWSGFHSNIFCVHWPYFPIFVCRWLMGRTVFGSRDGLQCLFLPDGLRLLFWYLTASWKGSWRRNFLLFYRSRQSHQTHRNRNFIRVKHTSFKPTETTDPTIITDSGDTGHDERTGLNTSSWLKPAMQREQKLLPVAADEARGDVALVCGGCPSVSGRG